MSFHICSVLEFFSVIENGDLGSVLTRLLKLFIGSCILKNQKLMLDYTTYNYRR